jgi:HB1/ASXL restriction endonuclease-like protein with HTH domain
MKKTTTKSKASRKTTAKAADPDLVPLTQAMKSKTTGKKSKATTKMPAEKKSKKLSCLDAAAQVLKTEGKPMNCKAMIDAMFKGKLWHSDAPTPAATLYSAILRETTTKKDASRFKKTQRGLFVFNG